MTLYLAKYRRGSYGYRLQTVCNVNTGEVDREVAQVHPETPPAESPFITYQQVEGPVVHFDKGFKEETTVSGEGILRQLKGLGIAEGSKQFNTVAAAYAKTYGQPLTAESPARPAWVPALKK